MKPNQDKLAFWRKGLPRARKRSETCAGLALPPLALAKYPRRFVLPISSLPWSWKISYHPTFGIGVSSEICYRNWKMENKTESHGRPRVSAVNSGRRYFPDNR